MPRWGTLNDEIHYRTLLVPTLGADRQIRDFVKAGPAKRWIWRSNASSKGDDTETAKSVR